jgi:hypothetical protein
LVIVAIHVQAIRPERLWLASHRGVIPAPVQSGNVPAGTSGEAVPFQGKRFPSRCTGFLGILG